MDASLLSHECSLSSSSIVSPIPTNSVVTSDFSIKVQTPEISWHNRERVFSVDIHPSGRLATCGQDKFLRVT